MMLPFLIGWGDTDCPEGHIESTTTPDGTIFPTDQSTITALLGTAHKGGDDQADADTKGIAYAIYHWWDRDKDGSADAGDEPIGLTVLTEDISDSDTTIPVASTATFRGVGWLRIGNEQVFYQSKTATSLILTAFGARGNNETDAASHSTGDAVTAVQAWEAASNGAAGSTYTCDGDTFSTIGWDAPTVHGDDGTEGDLFQGDGYIDAPRGRSYLLKLRIVDGSGNTNTEVDGADVFNSWGPDSYVSASGAADQGLEDDEVLHYVINEPPRRRFGRK